MAIGESRRGHWKIYTEPAAAIPAAIAPANPNGTFYGINFVGGMAYVNWQTLGVEATEKAIQSLGSDPRFRVTEIPEQIYPLGIK